MRYLKHLFLRRIPPLAMEEQLTTMDIRLAQLLRLVEANSQANRELGERQEDHQRQLEVSGRHNEALRDTATDLRTSIMELRAGQALHQSQLEDLRNKFAELLKEQALLVQVVSQQQQVLLDFQHITKAILERMSVDHQDFRQTISLMLDQIHQTIQYLVLQAGGTPRSPVKHPEAEGDPPPPSSHSQAETISPSESFPAS
ncbi:MAG: hypothetical protein NW237_05480 [Cyanobacteriota bacterium]|nr:hypothetical protein [Cyanobacteriota bacterium]